MSPVRSVDTLMRNESSQSLEFEKRIYLVWLSYSCEKTSLRLEPNLLQPASSSKTCRQADGCLRNEHEDKLQA
ncbi:hypothetical protein RRG08_050549 [Elysia crispata]|uniref:Uncharacterized protein n=1 Tax=Elysia crispata TaxID=231223 RepID=A0AAE0Z8B9_9GAST|nr:hypothetical protein RRG08_050549 [Elysia crispata]